MADVQIIGRVGVKVTPETKGFYRAVRDDLREKEKTLPKVKIHATFSDVGLRSQILSTIRELNREIKGKDLYKIKFDATITGDRMKSTVKTAARQMSAIAKDPGNKVKFTADVDAALPVNVELNQVSQRKVEAEVQAWAKTFSAAISVRTKLNPGAKTLTQAELATLARSRRVSFIPVVDRAALRTAGTILSAMSGARLVTDFMSRLFEKIKNKDRAVPVIAATSEALLGLAAATLSASANLFSVSRGLAQIGPAALALPGILGGMVVATGALIAVLKDFNQVFPGFADRLSALQDQMSTNFYAEAERPIRRFINTLFPAFAAGIQGTSTQLGKFFAGLANGLRQNLSGGVLTTMFDNLNESIKIATGATGDMSSIIAILGTVGTEYLSRLAGWFVNITGQFEAFLSKADADGRLRGWIDLGIVRLKELGSVLASLSSIFTSIAIAAEKAGGSTLTSMAESLRGIAETAKGEAFQGGLIRTLEGANAALSNIAAISGGSFKAFMEDLSFFLNQAFPKAGETIGTVADALFSALSRPAVAKGFLEMLDGIQKGVEGLTPAFAPVADSLGAIAGKVGFLAAQFGPVFGEALAIMAKGIETLIPAFEPLIGLLSGTLLNTIQSVAGPLDNMFSTITDVMLNDVMPAITPIIEAFGELAQNALPLIIDGASQVIDALGPLLDSFGKLADLLLPVLVPVLKFLSGLIIGAVVGALVGAAQAIGGLIDIVVNLIDFFKNIFTGEWGAAWENVKGILSGALDVIVGLFKVWINVGLLRVAKLGWTALLGLFKLGWQGIVALFKNRSELLSKGFSLLWTAIKGLAKLGFKALVGLVKFGWKAIVALFTKAPGVALKLVKALWTKARELFTIGVQFVIAQAKLLPTRLGLLLGKMQTQAGKLISAMWTKVKELFTAGVQFAITQAKLLPTRLGLLLGRMRTLAGKLISAMWNKVKSLFLAGVKFAIRQIKLLPTRASLFFGRMQTKMGKLARQAWKKVKSLFKSGVSKAVSLIVSLAKRVGRGWKKIVTTTKDKAKSAWDTAKRLFKSGVSGAINQVKLLPTRVSLFFGRMQTKMSNLAKSAWTKVQNGFTSGVSQVVTTVKGLPLRIILGLGNLGRVLLGAGAQLIGGFIQGIKDMFGSVKDTLGNLTKKLTAWKGPPATDKVLLTPAGQMLIDGLIVGINSRREDLRKTLRDITDEIGGTEIAGPKMADLNTSQATSALRASIDGNLNSEGLVVKQKILNYYAAEGSSIDSEEDLFSAADRSRMVGF